MVEIEPDSVHLNTEANSYKMNQYFIDNPDMILGDMQEVSEHLGPELACVSYEDQYLELKHLHLYHPEVLHISDMHSFAYGTP